MKLKNKFVLVTIMMIFVIAALIPWIWLSNEYGLTNIPHFDLTMWIFMELYVLNCSVFFIGIALLMFTDGEDEKPKKQKKEKKLHVKSSAAKKKTNNKKSTRKVRKPVKPQNKSNDGSYVDEPLSGSDEKTENGSVEYPAEWDKREFQ